MKEKTYRCHLGQCALPQHSSQSYIYSVVDEKRNIGRLGYSMQSFGDADLFSSVASLVTQLNDSDACQNVRLSGFYLRLLISDLLLRQHERPRQDLGRRGWRGCCQSPSIQSNLRAS
jgi:hypothetical protein